MKILLVEDDLALRLYLNQTLVEHGYEVVQASDGQAGWEAFQKEKPDLVLSDIMMPRLNGLQLLEKIRKQNFDTIVVMESSVDSPEFTLQALRLKANDYLIKPIAEKDLLATMEKYQKVLESRTRDREVLGMIFRRDLGMRIGNSLTQVEKVIDRLMLETEHCIPQNQRLGIHLGLLEIIVNAIEHGNLGITYREKSEALDVTGIAWKELLELRSKTPPYADRQVTIEFKMSPEQCEWLITDGGSGFDFKKLPDPTDPDNILESHGRGIMLTRMQFDVFEYLGSGNQVRMVKRLKAI